MNQKILIGALVVIIAILGLLVAYLSLGVNKISTPVQSEINRKIAPIGNAEKSNKRAEEIKDVEWKLVSGDPKQDCSQLQYSGNMKVRGWYAWGTGYVEKEWMLKIADSDTGKFPKVFLNADVHTINSTVKLLDASPALEKELKLATKDNPKEIILRGYYLYCEGAPSVSVAPPTVPVVKDETVGWKTYTSNEIGFSFKHPASLTVEEVYEEKNQFTKKPHLNLSLYSSEINGGILVDTPVFGLEGYENISEENLSIGDVPTIIYVSAKLDYSNPAKPEGTRSPSDRVATVNFKHNQKDFIIFLYYKDSGSDKNYKEIKQILSTFQFSK